MPIYEYRCQDCGEEFEELTLSSNGAGTVQCRLCSSRRVKKMLSAFAVHDGGSSAPEPGPCGGCSSERRGMCGVE